MAKPTSTQFGVAVHVLSFLTGMGRPVSSEELAGSAGVNAVHIRRVLGPLREAGLVRSRPGPGGGWELARAPEQISVGEVWQLVQGDDPVLGLHGPNPSCPVGRGVDVALHDLDRQVADAMLARLTDVTVADVHAAALAVTGVGA